MIRKNILTHCIAIFAICLFGFLALGSAVSSPTVKTDGQTVVSSITSSHGVVHDMHPEQINYPDLKPYTSLGMVFATTTTKYDVNNFEISSQEGLVIMLLREAHEMGADDILNMRWSENTIWTETTLQSGSPSSASSSSVKKVRTKTITQSGSALAIKYLDK